MPIFNLSSRMAVSLNELPHMEDIPIAEDGAVKASVDVVDSAVAAFADSAFHPAFQGHEDLILGNIQLEELFDNELVHDGRTADQAEGVFGIDIFQMREESRHDTDILFPGARVVLVHGQLAVQVASFF